VLQLNDYISVKKLMCLDGKTALVTGGAGHLGSAISEALAELGAEIIILGQNSEKGNNFINSLKKNFNINASFHKIDLNSKSSIDSFLEGFSKKIDILVNNFFTWPSSMTIEDTNWEEFEETLTSGITSPFYLTKHIVEGMKKQKSGNIINIGSMYGIVSPNFKIYHKQPKMGNALAYNASKAAIIQMTKYLAVHLAQWNIRVNSISPGPFPRPGTFANGKEWFETELKEMNPMKKLGEPWHLKGAVMLLTTDLGSYMTGQNISIDGGWTTW